MRVQGARQEACALTQIASSQTHIQNTHTCRSYLLLAADEFCISDIDEDCGRKWSLDSEWDIKSRILDDEKEATDIGTETMGKVSEKKVRAKLEQKVSKKLIQAVIRRRLERAATLLSMMACCTCRSHRRSMRHACHLLSQCLMRRCCVITGCLTRGLAAGRGCACN